MNNSTISTQHHPHHIKQIIDFLNQPEGDDIEYTWIRPLVLARSCNAGGKALITADTPYTHRTLACKLCLKECAGQNALCVLQKMKLIPITGENISVIPDWCENPSSIKDRLN